MPTIQGCRTNSFVFTVLSIRQPRSISSTTFVVLFVFSFCLCFQHALIGRADCVLLSGHADCVLVFRGQRSPLPPSGRAGRWQGVGTKTHTGKARNPSPAFFLNM